MSAARRSRLAGGHSLFVPLAVQAVTAVCAQGPGREPVAELAAGTTAFEHVVHDLLLVDSRRSLDRTGCPRGTADGYSEPMLQRAAVLLAAGLALAGTAPAAGRTARAPVHAELRPTAGASRAHGSFSAGLSASSRRPRFLWTILFFGLTGPAVEADLRLRSPNGGVLFRLCRPCRAGQSGSTILTPRGVRAIESGRTYVVVRTARNPNGEIRGRPIASGKR